MLRVTVENDLSHLRESHELGDAASDRWCKAWVLRLQTCRNWAWILHTGKPTIKKARNSQLPLVIAYHRGQSPKLASPAPMLEKDLPGISRNLDLLFCLHLKERVFFVVVGLLLK